MPVCVFVCVPWRPQYNNSFYLHYFAKWPIYYELAEAPNKAIMGYSTTHSPPSTGVRVSVCVMVCV